MSSLWFSKQRAIIFQDTSHRLVFCDVFCIRIALRYELIFIHIIIVEIKCIFLNVNIANERLADVVLMQSRVFFCVFVCVCVKIYLPIIIPLGRQLVDLRMYV